MPLGDTIAAIATAPGTGGIGLVRVSGPAAEAIARRLFSPVPAEGFLPRRLHFGKIVAPATGAVLDRVLVALFRGPGSYTGEDTLEISCHGGPLILRTVLEAVFESGARPAARGEFTARAFLNGRLDLAQAQSVHDLITATSRSGLAQALDGLGGKLSRQIEGIRVELAEILASLEALIDFSEEDGLLPPADTPARIGALIDAIGTLAASYQRGRICREGVRVVIAGRPNVGKSSLLNRILGEPRAIVTPIAGTTRDFIEEAVEIGGIPVCLTDTAGLRLPEDEIERLGIERVWERIAEADAVLLLLDGSGGLTADDRELIDKVTGKPLVVVVNKSDLPRRLDEQELRRGLPPHTPAPVWISARHGDGLDLLAAALADLFRAAPPEGEAVATISHLYQKVALERTAGLLAPLRDGIPAGLAPELVAFELREALAALGEITGQTTPDEILGRIFANFCVGK